jgi:murein DD-endopeptidase MepM/ murein hydrolase activator NlpD
MSRARYTILIANRKTGVVRRLTLNRAPIILGAFFAVSMTGLAGLMTMGMSRSTDAEVVGLRASNENLKLENDSYRAATGELASQISSLQTALRQLADQAQLDPATREAMEKLPAVVKSQAMGGGAVPADLAAASKATAATGGPAAGTLGVLRDLLGVLEDRLASVRTKVEGQQALARATPSLWPMLGVWYTSGFGARKDPFTGEQEFHTGIDLAADKGTPVHATADGTIESAGYNGNYGNSILIEHGFGISTRFGHLSRFAVVTGQSVKRGEVIGYVGASGRATSPHLHYEILFNGTPTNPLRLLVGNR